MSAQGERVRCAVCSRVVAGRIPKGGNGTGLFPYRHLRTTFDNYRTDGWCQGRFTEGTPVREPKRKKR